MKILLLMALVSAGLHSQTSLTPPQLAIPPTTPGQVRIMALVGSSFRFIEIGTGLTLTSTASGFRIDAAAPPSQHPPKLQFLALKREADGRYGPHSAGLVTRNGVVQLLGVDYIVVGGFVVPGFDGWAITDTVVAWNVF